MNGKSLGYVLLLAVVLGLYFLADQLQGGGLMDMIEVAISNLP